MTSDSWRQCQIALKCRIHQHTQNWPAGFSFSDSTSGSLEKWKIELCCFLLTLTPLSSPWHSHNITLAAWTFNWQSDKIRNRMEKIWETKQQHCNQETRFCTLEPFENSIRMSLLTLSLCRRNRNYGGILINTQRHTLTNFSDVSPQRMMRKFSISENVVQ